MDVDVLSLALARGERTDMTGVCCGSVAFKPCRAGRAEDGWWRSSAKNGQDQQDQQDQQGTSKTWTSKSPATARRRAQSRPGHQRSRQSTSNPPDRPRPPSTTLEDSSERASALSTQAASSSPSSNQPGPRSTEEGVRSFPSPFSGPGCHHRWSFPFTD